MAANEIRRETPAHDDILGFFDTGISGANQWLISNFRDTLFPLKYLRNNSDDFVCVNAQSPHWRQQNAPIDSIHFHYVLDSAYTAGQTMVFDVFWTWVIPNTVLPALSSWNQSLNVSIVLDAVNPIAQYTNGIFSLITNGAAPNPDGYGIGALIRVVRKNGTYSGNLAILNCDIHASRDRSGSLNEYNDTVTP